LKGWVDGPLPPRFGAGGPFLFAFAAHRFRRIFVGEHMTRQQVLDLYFLDARHKLVELAAFLDRAERAAGQDDFRLRAFRAALTKLNGKKKHKAKDVLLAFSDLSKTPVPRAESKGATGAWNPKK